MNTQKNGHPMNEQPTNVKIEPVSYQRFAMDDIHPEARKIAVAWMEGWEEWMKTSITEKVKLASDIQNFAIAYANAQLSDRERTIQELRDSLNILINGETKK